MLSIMIKKENWLFFLYLVTMISIVTEARFFLSQAMIWLLLSGILTFTGRKFPFFSVSEDFKQNFSIVWKNKAFAVVPLFLIIVMLSIFWSSELPYWIEKTRIRLPFLVIPLAFAWLPTITKRHYQSVFYGMLILISIVSLGVLINYSLDYEAITSSLLHGKNIPVPMNHIRFSLLMSFAIVAGFILYAENFTWKYAWERKFIVGLSIFLIVAIHILSVRSGIVALYGTLFFLGFRFYIILKKQYLKGIFVGSLFILLPFAAYFLMPSLQNKVDYAIRDYQHFIKGDGADFSDAERLESIFVGIEIGNQAPLLGCGYGDLWKEIQATYARRFPREDELKLPHNQFVVIYAGLGVLGLSMFVFIFLFPLFYQKNYQDWYFLALHLIVFFSFLVEPTMETQVGTAIYSFFLGLGLNFTKTRS
jgi:O-antigen ligase